MNERNKFTNFFLDPSIDITREAYKNKDNEFNNKPVNRFETDIILNSKESFDSNNKKLNDLQDEISSLKQKLKTIYEKEEEIYKLKLEIDTFKKDKSSNELLSSEISQLKSENKNLRDRIDKLNLESMNIQSLKQENILLKDKLKTVKRVDDSKYSEDIEETEDTIDTIDTIDKLMNIDDSPTYKKSSAPVMENKKEKEEIYIDVNKLKNVLFNRLKTYHERHIDSLINNYDLHNKEKVDKDIMEKILLEAIHI